MITNENWTHTSYKNENLNALITFGSAPDILDDRFTYYLTVLDHEQNEVYQEEFTTLDNACSQINKKYLDYFLIQYKDIGPTK